MHSTSVDSAASTWHHVALPMPCLAQAVSGACLLHTITHLGCCTTRAATNLTNLAPDCMHVGHQQACICIGTGRKERMTLNSTDRTYKDLRDVSFAAVGPRLGTRAKALQSQYKDTKVHAGMIACMHFSIWSLR